MKPAHILLVEDNLTDVFLTKKAIEVSRLDVTLHVVNRGEDAIDFLLCRNGFETATTPHLVLLDFNLPSLSGLDVLKKIKNAEALKHIPTIMLTSSNRAVDIQNCYSNHANSYITKPLKVSGLAEVLQTLSEFWFNTAKLPST